MALADLLQLNQEQKKIGVSNERASAVISVLREYFAQWREYPDMFIDFLQTGGDPTRKKTLEFYFYQRLFLRAAMRHKYVYMVFPRA